MPYADPTEQKAYNLALYLRRYQSDPEFRDDEAFRKKVWYYRNQEKIVARYRKKRKKIRAASKPVRFGKIQPTFQPAFFSAAQDVALLL